jgi:hypothetical protein
LNALSPPSFPLLTIKDERDDISVCDLMKLPAVLT